MRRLYLDSDQRDFVVYRNGSGGTVEIWDIAVGSERRKGRGRRLVEKVIHEVSGKASFVWAITRRSNEIAQEFYEGIGFKLCGVLHRFYGSEDGVMYGRKVE